MLGVCCFARVVVLCCAGVGFFAYVASRGVLVPRVVIAPRGSCLWCGCGYACGAACVGDVVVLMLWRPCGDHCACVSAGCRSDMLAPTLWHPCGNRA